VAQQVNMSQKVLELGREPSLSFRKAKSQNGNEFDFVVNKKFFSIFFFFSRE